MTIRSCVVALTLTLGTAPALVSQQPFSAAAAEPAALYGVARCASASSVADLTCPRPHRPHLELEVRRQAGMSTLRKATIAYALAHLSEGTLGSLDATVQSVGPDDDDQLINTETGEILGISAINPAHAVLHLGWAGFGAWAQSSDDRASRYMKASTALWGALTVAGFARGLDSDQEIYEVAGLALDTEANLIHAAITGVAAYFGFVR